MKNLTLVSLMLLFSCSIFAQNTSSKEAREIKKRTLIIGLEELNAKSAKKLSGESLENTMAQIEGANLALKTAVENNWNYNSKILYMPLSEATAMMKKSPNEYAVMQLFKYTDNWNINVGSGWVRDNSYRGNSGSFANSYRYNPGTRYTEAANQIIFLCIYMPSRVCAINLPNLYVSMSDAVYGVTQMQYLLNRLNEDEKLNAVKVVQECNGKYLKEKTLLLCKDDLDKKLTESKIQEIYPYKFKVVSSAEIDTAIISKDENSVIVQIVSSAGGKGNVNIHFLGDTQTGRIVGYVAPSMAFGVGTTSIVKYNERIKEKQIKGYLEIANCK